MDNSNNYNLALAKNYSACRESSWDKTGGNADAWYIAPGETKVIADLKGPGVISHIWFTINSPDKYYLRKILLRIYWDGESEPSVYSPVGDFFGLGHSRSFTYDCAAFSCSSNSGKKGAVGDGVAMNCWLPMPFKKSAHVEIVNEQAEPINSFYFYVDWEKHDSISDDTLYFHAAWRRENHAGADKEPTEDNLRGVSLCDKNNYLLLYAQGRGHFIGINMSIDNFSNNWWGEGDDMFFIDRDEGSLESGGNWPPNLHGTGSEDYLCHAWGMQRTNSLYHGQHWFDDSFDNNHIHGKVCVFKHHLTSPIPFTKKLRISIEHGHANDQANDISSVAYWYQDEPHTKFVEMLPWEKRLPL